HFTPGGPRAAVWIAQVCSVRNASVVEIRILGPVEASVDGQVVPLPRPKQRALLVLLALEVGKVVAVDRLIEDLWAGRPPTFARNPLQNPVHQLRRALGSETILSRPPGYLLDLAPE